MKELYNKYFKIVEGERISDKKMLVRIISAVTIIVLCLTLLSMTALAYFSFSLKSGSNTVVPATFYVDTKFSTTTGEQTAGPTKQHQQISFPANNDVQTYTITISIGEQSTADTGYCKVMIGNDEYYTAQFVKGVENKTKITLTLKYTSTSDFDVDVYSYWGTYSGEARLTNGKTITNTNGTITLS